MTTGNSDTAPNPRQMSNAIRALSMDAVQQANSGHPGAPMGMADIATVLFTKFLKFDPSDPAWPDRDRFVLSNGHGSMLLYSLLYLTGYDDIDIDQVRNFRQLGSRTAGHPEYGHARGIETTTGPLGQGIANAVGMALAERMMEARFGTDIVDHYTYVFAGDGCLMEGISHEAISLAGHLKLGKLIVLFDDNDISIDGPTDMAVSDDQLKRFEASGWETSRVDGHDHDAIAGAIEAARKSDKPSLIACKTVIGYGAPNKEGTASTHGAPLGDDEIAGAREKLGWPHAPFEVPEDILNAWRSAGRQAAAERQAWNGRLSALEAAKRDAFERAVAGDLPADFDAAVEAYKKELAEDPPKLATRQASQKALNVLTKAVPEMIGGSADLTGSNLTLADGMEAVSAENYGGSHIYYGVREHGMAAAMNGMALHGGLIPYGATFLVFTDYCRPSIRLSALMKQRVIYVMTHDSIGLGEDGPTHQPVEHLSSLRAMPNVNVFRPCDAIETAECWQIALQSKETPSVMALTRQGLAPTRTTHSAENLSAKGGYIAADADGERKATIIATGSEVEIALAAREALQADGIGTAVVSMPCQELFDAQDEAYRQSVLGPENARVAVEAAVKLGWDRYIGPKGGFVGMDGFGASAPAGELYQPFGITASAVEAAIRERV
ncbi:MAG: transketolase [Rhodospirillaceae bacterium]|nr:transketolase [Rhodospirillaceae bacterium]